MLSELANKSVDLGNSPELDKNIPGTDDTSLSDVIDPAEAFEEDVLSPVAELLSKETNPSVDEFLGAIGGGSSLDGATTTAFRHEGSKYLFDIHFRHQVKHPQKIDLGFGAGQGDLPFDLSVNVDLIAEFNFSFTLGIDLLALSDLNNSVFVQIHEVSVRAFIEAFDLDASLQLGFLEASIQDGRLLLDSTLSASFTDPNFDGRLTLGELRENSFADLVDLAFSGSLEANIPIHASIGSFSTSTSTPPTITVHDAELFDTNLPEIAFSNFESIIDFGSFDSGSILAMLRSLATRLREMGHTSLFDFEIPFTDRRLGDALDFGLDFVDTLSNATGDPTFSGAQSLATKLAVALGVDPSIIQPQFDSLTRELTYSINYQKSIHVSPSFGFDADLAPIADIKANGNLDFSGNVDFALTFGVDVSPVTAKIVAGATAPSNGNFNGEAVIQLQVGADLPVVVRFFGTGNNTLDDLIADINQALRTAGLAVQASAVANRIQLRTTHITATPTLKIEIDASNPAATILHLPTSGDAFDNVANHIFIRDQRVSADLALIGQLTAEAKFGFVGLTGGLSAAGNLNIDFQPAAGARLGLLDLYKSITTDLSQLGTPSITGSSRFHIDQLQVTAAGLDLGLPSTIPPGQHQISVTIADYVNAIPQLSLDQSLLAGLNQLRDLDFDDVLAALRALAERMVDLAKNGLMGTEIPGTGLSAGDLMNFAEDFLALVEEMQKPENRASRSRI